MCYGQGCGPDDLVHSLYDSTPGHADDLLTRIVLMRRALDRAPYGSSFIWCSVMFQLTVQVLTEVEQLWGDDNAQAGADDLLSAILDAMYEGEAYDIENSYKDELKSFKRYVTAAFNGWADHKAPLTERWCGPRIPTQTVKNLVRMCALLASRCYALEAGFIDGIDEVHGARYWFEQVGISIPEQAMFLCLEDE